MNTTDFHRTGLNIKLIPKAGRQEISAIQEDGTVKIKVNAPPVDGKANQALIKFLAEALQIKTSAIEIVSGHTARSKILMISGLEERLIWDRLKSAVKKK